jgi:CheY-like chemotaxis protein
MLLGRQAGYLVDLEYFLRKIGYEVLSESAGLPGIHEFRPRVVLAETALGNVDAYGLCARVKSDPALKDTVFVFMSRGGADEVHERGAASGGEFFLQVPVDPSDVGVDLYMLFSSNFRIDTDPPPMLRTFSRIPKRTAPANGHPWHPIQHSHGGENLVITKSDPTEQVIETAELPLPSSHPVHLPTATCAQPVNDEADLSQVHNLLMALTNSLKDSFKRLEAVIQYIELTADKKDGQVWENR